MYEVLEEVGLSRNESKAYLALLELGMTTTGPVARKASIDRANAYYSLERLNTKGLVSQIFKRGVKYFEAAEPSVLKNILLEKEEKLDLLIPKLNLSRNLSGNKGETHIYKGLKSYISILEGFLDYDEPILIFGIPVIAVSRLKFFYPQFQKRRIDKRVEQKEIYNHDARSMVCDKKVFLSQKRFFPKGFDSPVSICICGDEVVLVFWDSIPMITRIISEHIALTFKHYFSILWEHSLD